ncbi:MAG: acyl-CoA dehydrogenase C-terminal domain-containing protein [Pseudomonadota bacterium]
MRRELEDTMTATSELVAAASSCSRSRLLANATLYLDMLGHLVIAWMWLRQAVTAEAKREDKPSDDSEASAYLQGKYFACRYFFRYVLPQCAWMRELATAADDTTLAMPEDGF